MYRIMVVEDEPPIARYICHLLENMKEFFQVTVIAGNGKEGVQLYEKYKTDLVITDVRMPQMDGLSMLEQIKKINPKVKGIIISDFRDFEYARSGMRLGVENYLIKPVTQEQMRESLLKLKAELDKETQQKKKEEFRQLLWGNNTLDIETGEWEKSCRLLVVQKGCMTHSRMTYLAEGRAEKWEDFLERLNEDSFVQIWSYGMEENVIVILYKGNKQKISEIPLGKESYVTVACSPILSQMSDLRTYYKNCQKLLYYCTVIGRSQVVFQDQFKKKKLDFAYLEERKEILYKAIKRGKFETIKYELIIYFDELEKHEIPQYCIEKILQEIFSWAEYRREITYEQQQNCLAEIIMVARNLSEVLGGVLELLSSGWKFEEENRRGKERADKIIYSIENYIQMHLESVSSLQDISDIFGLSQTYICRLFHNYRKQSFKDYVTGLKIEKAKELLDHEMQIKDVSDYLGYQDSFYFSKVFKKKTGKSPSDYKKRRKTNEV